ncbi:MAG: pyridoxamine 5'-phosphate oxidase family protein [Azospirillaceae bacterium]
MGHRFAELAFTGLVQAEQERQGSRKAYARAEDGEPHHDCLGERERAFIERRDSFYIASVGETGWPYIQHRGGPPGFLRVLDGRTIGFADFRGNRQYVTVGNLAGDDRVSLILVDYRARQRLKILGRARVVEADAAVARRLAVPDYRAVVERAMLIEIAAFDWNCPQHIPRLVPAAEAEATIAALEARIAALEGRQTGR